MTPSQAIEKARQDMVGHLTEGAEVGSRRYVWQPPSTEFPSQNHSWEVFGYGPPPDGRPYYVVWLSGYLTPSGQPHYTDKVELFNKPDYARPTVWDRLAASEPPSR